MPKSNDPAKPKTKTPEPPEPKSAVGVSAIYVNNQPRIAVAFFLDSDAIQTTTDDEGRPIVVGLFDPEAAHVALSRKIKEARESLRRSAGVTDYITPYLSIATLCDNILFESDGVVSLIRLADIYNFTSDPLLPTPNMALLLKGLLQFRGGPENFYIRIVVIAPGDEVLINIAAPVDLHGGSHFYSVKIELPIPVSREGMYRLEVYRETEQLARLPFQVRRSLHQPNPLSSPALPLS